MYKVKNELSIVSAYILLSLVPDHNAAVTIQLQTGVLFVLQRDKQIFQHALLSLLQNYFLCLFPMYFVLDSLRFIPKTKNVYA